MSEPPVDPGKVIIDRNEFARAMNVWVAYAVGLVRPLVDRDPAFAARHIRGASRAFVGAVAGETRHPFLQEHAVDFAKAIEQAALDESVLAKLRGETNAERKEARPVYRRQPPSSKTIRARPPKDVGD